MTTVKARIAQFNKGLGPAGLTLAAFNLPASGAILPDGLQQLPSISSITATNKPQLQVLAPAPVEPELADLALLDELEPADKHQWTNVLPTAVSMTTLSNNWGTTAGGDDINQVIEDIKAKDLMRAATEHKNNGDTTRAIELLQDELKGFTAKSAIVEVQSMLGLLHYTMQDFDKAAQSFEAALDTKIHKPELACNLAAIYLYQGRIDEAVDVLSDIHVELLVQNNLKFSTHFNLACAYSLRNEAGPALNHLELAAQFDPPNTYTSLGDTMLDNIRDEELFAQIRDTLQQFMNRNR